MRAVVQVVSEARVTVLEDDGHWHEVAAVHEPALVVLVAATHDDTTDDAQRLADKIWRLRIMQREQSAEQLGAPVVVVSQFTLFADVRKGRRPSWSAAAPRSLSEPLVDEFAAALRRLGASVPTGRFGATMRVHLVNDGPMTLVLDSRVSPTAPATPGPR